MTQRLSSVISLVQQNNAAAARHTDEHDFKFKGGFPWNLVGYILGTLALLLVVAVLFNLPIPLIPNARTAIEVLTGLMLVKLLVAQFYPRRV